RSSPLPPPPPPPLFPYTTLFRSQPTLWQAGGAVLILLGQNRRATAMLGQSERHERLVAHIPEADAQGQLAIPGCRRRDVDPGKIDRKSTRLNSSHVKISYAVFCL